METEIQKENEEKKEYLKSYRRAVNQVVDAQVRKFFSENPRVEVTIRKVEG